MSSDSIILDLDVPKHKQMVIGWIRSCKGPHKIKISKVRQTRTQSQNAWYWACVLPAVANGLLDAWGEDLSTEEVHEWLKGRFNSQPIVDRTTGEIKGKRPCSTAALDTKQFSEFIDKVIQFAGEQLQVEIPPPSK